jgi:signal transduction histidine kinase/CheY-like chemotaxis protein
MHSSRTAADPAEANFLGGGSEMAERMSAHDWSASALGAPASWAQSLRSVVGLMLGSSFPMFLAWGEELSFLYNDGYRDVLGAKHPDALGRPFNEIWPEIWSDLSPLVDAALAGHASYRDDLPLVMRRKGFDEQTFFTFSYSPVRDEAGRVAGVFCACTETTGRVQLERRQALQLELEAGLLRAQSVDDIMSTAAAALGRHLGAQRVGYGEIRHDESISFLSHCYVDGLEPLSGSYRLVSLGSDSMERQRQGRPEVCNDVLDDPGQDPSVWSAIETRSFVSVPLIRDGRFRASLYVHCREPRRWTGEEVAFIEGVAARTWDAVERARAEAALREREALWRTFFENMHEGFASCEVIYNSDAAAVDFRYLEINAAAARLIGFPREQILGQLASVAIPAIEQWWTDTYAQVVETGEPTHFEYEIASIGQWFEVYAYRTGPARFGALFLNITERRKNEAELRQLNATLEERVHERTTELFRAQEALRQSQKLEAMGQLTGGVAHDFNNLLTPIIGGLDLLQRRGIDHERAGRIIDAALQSAERAKTLVQRLLAFARRQPLQRTAVDLPSLIEGMADLVSSTSGPQIKVLVDVPQGLPPALADANQLEMAVLNLSVNSRDAMPDGGTLTISAALKEVGAGHRSTLPSGSYIRLAVADTGVGMDEETCKRAIEPFYSTKGVGRGTGLGLSMVHGLVAQLGGALSIQSRLGFGTIVELWMPLADELPERGAAQPDAKLPQATGMALVVDDEDLVRASTAEMLSDLGYYVVEASSGDEALKLLESGLRPDVIVTDHLMPGLSGTELARAVREQLPATRVLVISGYAEIDGLPADIPRLGKPFRRGELISAIADLGRGLN